MKFTKMQGIGNDYVYINCFEETVTDPKALAITVSDRHFGIGSDGLIMICQSDIADFRMRMFNADGSEGEMCGNGIRCVGKFVYDKGLTDNKTVSIETLAGIKILELFTVDNMVEKVKVDMGEPILKPSDIPVLLGNETCISLEISTDDDSYLATCVSMGNPHAVVYVESVDMIEVEKKGPPMENNEVFPNRVNTEFVEVMNNGELKMRVWERGSGETLACGTGACAVLVASVLNNKSSRENIIHLLGGNLEIKWDETDNHVYMTGPAVTVFEGDIII
ncbi:MAG: diaminopimelate epimerase [Clostridiales bacterium]|nr:diaminopimelate epimerase [Clostridiales bacterium]